MRFACQSCGKAYNLPEERIAEKTNVKLKCRVCGAIVEVKKHGEVVAQMLTDVDGRRGGRVSEAPPPLASMSPDDPEDATAAIAIGDGIPAELGLPPLPPPPPTGFPIPPLPPPPVRLEVAAPTRSEPPLAPPLPSPAAMSAAMSPAAMMGGSSPPPLTPDAAMDLPGMNGSSMSNGSPTRGGAFGGPAAANPAHGMPNMNGAHAQLGHSPMPLGAMDPELEDAQPAVGLAHAPQLSNAVASAPVGNGAAPVTLTSLGSAEAPSTRAESDDTNKKMLAAFLTGIVVDRIVSGLFF